MSRLARRFIRFEVGIWRSLLLWAARRRPGQGPGVQAFTYSRDLLPIMLALIFVSTLELVVVHLLLPWETVRLIADVLSVWGLLWMLGLLAGVRIHPHLVTAAALHVRSGADTDVAVPWEAVASVASKRRSTSARGSVSVDEAVLTVAVMRQTRVDVVLHEPITVALPDGPVEVTELRLYADNARALVRAARARLSQAQLVQR
jgi:hypothetical protein